MSLVIIGLLGGLIDATGVVRHIAFAEGNYAATASEVRMVLAGTGDVRVRLEGGAERIVHVSGTPRSYAVVERGHEGRSVLDVTVPSGVEAYSFTFG